MAPTITMILQVFAFILLVMAAFRVPEGRFSFGWSGAALIVGSLLITSISTIGK